MNKKERARVLNRIFVESLYIDEKPESLDYFKGAVCGLLSFIGGQDPCEPIESINKKVELFRFIRGLESVKHSDVSKIQLKVDELYFDGEFEKILKEDVVI